MIRYFKVAKDCLQLAGVPDIDLDLKGPHLGDEKGYSDYLYALRQDITGVTSLKIEEVLTRSVEPPIVSKTCKVIPFSRTPRERINQGRGNFQVRLRVPDKQATEDHLFTLESELKSLQLSFGGNILESEVHRGEADWSVAEDIPKNYAILQALPRGTFLNLDGIPKGVLGQFLDFLEYNQELYRSKQVRFDFAPANPFFTSITKSFVVSPDESRLYCIETSLISDAKNPIRTRFNNILLKLLDY